MNSHIRQHAGLWATPIALLLLAFVFRVGGLAKYDFWFDEASQAIASQSESVSQTLHIVSRAYGGAPLDHLITRANGPRCALRSRRSLCAMLRNCASILSAFCWAAYCC